MPPHRQPKAGEWVKAECRWCGFQGRLVEVTRSRHICLDEGRNDYGKQPRTEDDSVSGLSGVS